MLSFFQIVLDSDDALFGGFDRLNHSAEYFTSVWDFSKLVSECAPCSGVGTEVSCCVVSCLYFPIRVLLHSCRPDFSVLTIPMNSLR